ncbi:hypothetical protein [Mycobacterium sp. E342]|uniref:hypothetical protein n=1 Tax=Mycobacterium sp. E342 TaxID=1834147 RepID=UPI000A7C44EC|nr:hypothetical protein [Mycobacterium sp. E342]
MNPNPFSPEHDSNARPGDPVDAYHSQPAQQQMEDFTAAATATHQQATDLHQPHD